MNGNSKQFDPKAWKQKVVDAQRERDVKSRKKEQDPSDPWVSTPGLNLLTQKQFCKLMHISLATARRWRREGKGPPFLQWAHNAIRYRQQDIEDWFETQLSQTTAQADRRIQKMGKRKKAEKEYEEHGPTADGSNAPR